MPNNASNSTVAFERICEVREFSANLMKLMMLSLATAVGMTWCAESLHEQQRDVPELVAKSAGLCMFLFRTSVALLVLILAAESIACVVAARQAGSKCLAASMIVFMVSSAAVVVALGGVAYWGWRMHENPWVPFEWIPNSLLGRMERSFPSSGWWMRALHFAYWMRLLASALTCIAIAFEFKTKPSRILAALAAVYVAGWSTAVLVLLGYVPQLWHVVSNWPFAIVYPVVVLLALPIEFLLEAAYSNS